jgi:hypothetical protein
VKIIWKVDPGDIAQVKAFFNEHKDNHFVKSRIATNLADDKPAVALEFFWDRMVGCLLTTQQRAGPESPVAKFLRTRPFPLKYGLIKEHDDAAPFARKVLGEFGEIERIIREHGEPGSGAALS